MPARYATTPTPGAAHHTKQVAAVSAWLGRPLIPWQIDAARLITELAPHGPGWRWPVVVIVVPRRSGKTVLLSAVQVQRALQLAPHRIFYTAQTGKDARARWAELHELLQSAPPTKAAARLRSRIARVTLAASDPCIHWRNRSQIRPFAPVPNSLDGYDSDLLIVDEAMRHSVDAGTALLASIGPTQLTSPWRQLIIVSAAGKPSATWLMDWVKRGRESVHDPGSGMAYLEYSADEAADPYSPETWAAVHPAYGYHVDAAGMAAMMAQSKNPEEFRRNYLNMWTITAEETVIPLNTWDGLKTNDEASRPRLDQVHVAFDAALDRSSATIAAAWPTSTGVHAEVTVTRSGTSWLASALAALEEAGCASITADPMGPTRTILGQLPVSSQARALSSREYATACQAFSDRVAAGTITHDGSPAVRDAILAARQRQLAGAIAWDAVKSTGPIDALRAITLAASAAAETPIGVPIT